MPGPASSLFRIDPKSGAIFALRSFDREKNDSFILDVQAEDGALSSLPGAQGPNFGKPIFTYVTFLNYMDEFFSAITKVQIFVGDINDNVPFFNQS